MSYYHAKKTAEAKRYLDERDIQQRIKLHDTRMQDSRDWLREYRASGKAQTKFDWRPRFAFTPPQPSHDLVPQPPESELPHEEAQADAIIEGEFTVVKEVDRTSFTEQDLTPF